MLASTTYSRAASPSLYLHGCLTWSLLHSETCIHPGTLSCGCHSHPRLRFRWTILSATGPGGDNDAVADSGGARLTCSFSVLLLLPKGKACCACAALTVTQRAFTGLVGCLRSLVGWLRSISVKKIKIIILIIIFLKCN